MQEEHWTDENGNPAGGNTFGIGFAIGWQHGPLGRDGDRIKPNGAFVENIIKAALGRLRYYQKSKFKCDRNAVAIAKLEGALDSLQSRIAEREARKVEGTHEV